MPNVKLVKFLDQVFRLHTTVSRSPSAKDEFEREVRKLLDKHLPDWDQNSAEAEDPFLPFTECVEQFNAEMLSIEDELSERDKKGLVELLKKHFLYDHLLALAAQEDEFLSCNYSPVIIEIMHELMPAYQEDKCLTWVKEVLEFTKAHKTHVANHGRDEE